MMMYRVNVRGSVRDTETDFSCGFDFTVNNGGSVENIGKSLQMAINNMKVKGHKIGSQPIESPTESRAE